MSEPDDQHYHAANYVDMQYQPSNCNGAGACWIQEGNMIGYASNMGPGYDASDCQTSVVAAYVEESDVNAYDCTDFEGSITLASDSQYSEWYTGIYNGSGDGLVDAYLVQNGTPTLLGQAWLPDYASSLAYAQSELFAAYGYAGNPTISQYEGFGGSPWPLEVYTNQPNGTWSDWSTSLYQGPDSRLDFYPNPPSSSDSFLTWTGS